MKMTERIDSTDSLPISTTRYLTQRVGSHVEREVDRSIQESEKTLRYIHTTYYIHTYKEIQRAKIDREIKRLKIDKLNKRRSRIDR